MTASVAIAIVVIVLWIYFLWSRRKLYAFAFKMPGALGLPIIGIAYKIYNIRGILYSLPKLAASCKSNTIFTFFGTIPVLYTMEPKVAEIVLSSPHCINKTRIYKSVTNTIGDGLVTLNSPQWNNHRKLLNPAFKAKVLLNFLTTFNKLSHDLCDKLNPLVGCGETNIVADLVFDMTFKAVSSTTMGCGLNEYSYPDFVENFRTMQHLVIDGLLKPWRRTVFYKGTETYKKLMESRHNFLNFVQKVVRNKLNSPKPKDRDEENVSSALVEEYADITKKNHVFIDRAIELYQNNEFTLDEVISESNLIIVAGSDTSAITTYSALIHLAIHPQIQQTLFEEIVSVFPNEEFDVKHEDLKSLVFLDMCVNETLRHSPAVPMIGRTCSIDIPLSKDKIIPKGTELLIDIFNIHRNKDIWGPNVNAFDPYNFLPANVASRHSYSFLPFSKGQRNCIGWQYAYLMVKIILVQVLRKYRFSTKWRMEDIIYTEDIALDYKTVPCLEIHRR